MTGKASGEKEYSFIYLNKVDTAGCQQLFTTFRNWMEPRTVPTMNLVKLLKCVAFAAATLPCHDRNQDAREVVTQRCELLKCHLFHISKKAENRSKQI